jgi:hypothetical protein
MSGKYGLQARIQAAVRKRRHKGRPQPVPIGNVRSDRWDEITRSHADVLENIERTLLDCWSVCEDLDDQWVHLGLVGAMRDQPPDHPTSSYVYGRLKKVRERLNDVPPDIWLDALRVVDQSVRDHSSLRHKDISYLTLILAFLKDALDA